MTEQSQAPELPRQKYTIELTEGLNFIPLPDFKGNRKTIPFDEGFLASGVMETSIPTPEEYQLELQRFVDELASKGGKITEILSEMVIDENNNTTKKANLLLVEKVKALPKTEVVILPEAPELQEAKNALKFTRDVKRFGNILTAGLFYYDRPNVAVAERESKWNLRMQDFITQLDGPVIAKIEGRIVNSETGEITLRNFLIVEKNQTESLPTPSSTSSESSAGETPSSKT